jgi:hypothetical protein
MAFFLLGPPLSLAPPIPLSLAPPPLSLAPPPNAISSLRELPPALTVATCMYGSIEVGRSGGALQVFATWCVWRSGRDVAGVAILEVWRAGGIGTAPQVLRACMYGCMEGWRAGGLEVRRRCCDVYATCMRRGIYGRYGALQIKGIIAVIDICAHYLFYVDNVWVIY